MQRDMDLCRAILLNIEAHPHVEKWFAQIEIDGYSQEQIWYHIRLLGQAGLIEVIDMGTGEWMAGELTNAGHDFLDFYRQNTNWQRATAVLVKTVGTVTLEGLKALAPRLAKEAIDRYFQQ